MLNAIVFTENDIHIMCGHYSKTRPKIKKVIKIPYPENSYVNGDIVNHETLASAILEVLRKEKMKGSAILLGIQHPQINIIELSIPYVKGKIMQAVNVKLSERFIGISEENYISYKISKIEGNMCYGLASVVPHKILDEYYKLSMKLGLPLKAIDCMGNIFYKSIHLENKSIDKDTFIIAESDENEMFAHLYHEGVLKNTRGENGNQLFIQEEPVNVEFVFQNRLAFTEEDIESCAKLYKDVQLGIDDLYAVRSTIEIFIQRYKEKLDEDVNKADLESALSIIDKSLIDIKGLCSKQLDYNETLQKSTLKRIQELLMRLQKIDVEFRNIEYLRNSFINEIQEILNVMKIKVQQISEIFSRYVINDVEQSRQDRQLNLQAICKIVNQMIVKADMSQNYPEISTVYVEGMMLDPNEKKLMEQNLGKYYTVEVRNYESVISDLNQPYLGIYYNDYSYFQDLDLAATVAKNDKLNRNNYDNIILGIGWCMAFAVLCIVGLWGYNKYDIYQLTNLTNANNQFIEENKSVDLIVSREQKLRESVEEIEKFQEYFSLVNPDMNAVHETLQDLSKNVNVSDISIDNNFVINIKLQAKSLENISAYLETLRKEGYQLVTYDSVTVKDGKYEVTVNYKYVPK